MVLEDFITHTMYEYLLRSVFIKGGPGLSHDSELWVQDDGLEMYLQLLEGGFGSMRTMLPQIKICPKTKS